jgi:predicted nucleic acid-binding protein
VCEWWAEEQSGKLFTTTATVAEILYGIELLHRGKRREKLLAEAEAMFAQDFAGRILPFDEEADRAFQKWQPDAAAGKAARCWIRRTDRGYRPLPPRYLSHAQHRRLRRLWRASSKPLARR